MADEYFYIEDQAIDIDEACARTTISHAQWYRLEEAGLLPSRRQLGRRKVGIIQSDLDTWLLSRPRTIGNLFIAVDPAPTGVRVLTEKQVIASVAMSRSLIRRMIEADEFPAPIKLSSRKIGFLKHEVFLWLKNRPRLRQPPPTLKPPPPPPNGRGSPNERSLES